ncbi:MAG: ScyD/ScyE family protein [Actinomycetota bacterium]
MHKSRVRPSRTLVALLVIAAMSMLASGVEAETLPWTVVAKHLDNPHGVGFISDGRMIVSESGHSGNVCVYDGAVCFGLNSKVSATDLSTGERTRLAGGLVSAFFPFEAFGLGGVSVINDRILVAIGLNPQAFGSVADACRGQGSVCRDKIKAIKHQAGRLIEIDPGGGWTPVASVGAYDYDWIVEENPSPGNPDFQPGDADPFGLLAAPEGTYIADGGSNTIGIVDNAGAVSVFAYLPDPPNHEPLYDAVATCVAKAGGAVYVGTLTGSLFKWQSNVLTQVLTGDPFRAIVGCTSDAAGNLYVVNLSQQFRDFNPKPATGSIVKVAPDLTTSYVIDPEQGLNYPNGITFGPDGALYVTINSICPANPKLAYAVGISKEYCPTGGQVIRLEV